MAGKAELVLAALVTSSAPMNYRAIPDIGFSSAGFSHYSTASQAAPAASPSQMSMDEFTARMEHLRDQLQQLENQPLPGLDGTPPTHNNAKTK